MIFTILLATPCWAPPMHRPFLTHSVWILPTTLVRNVPHWSPTPEAQTGAQNHESYSLYSVELQFEASSDSWVQFGGIINLLACNMLFALLDRERGKQRSKMSWMNYWNGSGSQKPGLLSAVWSMKSLLDIVNLCFQIATPRKEYLQIQVTLWSWWGFVSFVSGVSNRRWC